MGYGMWLRTVQAFFHNGWCLDAGSQYSDPTLAAPEPSDINRHIFQHIWAMPRAGSRGSCPVPSAASMPTQRWGGSPGTSPASIPPAKRRIQSDACLARILMATMIACGYCGFAGLGVCAAVWQKGEYHHLGVGVWKRDPWVHPLVSGVFWPHF